jgi:hypothetical protein
MSSAIVARLEQIKQECFSGIQEGPLSCLTNASPVDEDAEHNDNDDSDDQRRRVVCLAFCVGWACLLYQRCAIRRVAPKKAGRFIGDWIVKFFHDAGD